MTHLGLDDQVLAARQAAWTAREIEQQPAAWLRTHAAVTRAAPAVQRFLAPLLARGELRIILTGAGSSAYVGECLAPELTRRLGRRVEAIPTTDLVDAPGERLQRQVPTLLVSFARSGNSPESIAAIDVAGRATDECHHLIITCNADGALCRGGLGRGDTFVFLLPEETHDRGFAMTSSFSSMLYAAWALLGGADASGTAAGRVGAAAARVLAECGPALESLAAAGHDRVVYLGSGSRHGLAREAALKLLELTDGKVVAMAETPLGFRHGPKTFVTPTTLVVEFVASDPAVRRYDLDLLYELRNDAIAGRILAVAGEPIAGVPAGDCVLLEGLDPAAGMELLFPALVCAQLYAFHRALREGTTPDSPSASGTVSRVVRGVTIY